jgi:hypothetical protein
VAVTIVMIAVALALALALAVAVAQELFRVVEGVGARLSPV